MIEKHLESEKKIKAAKNEIMLIKNYLKSIIGTVFLTFFVFLFSYYSIGISDSINLIKEVFDPLTEQMHSMSYFEARNAGINLDSIQLKHVNDVFLRELTILLNPFVLFILNFFFFVNLTFDDEKRHEVNNFNMAAFCIFILSLMTMVCIFYNFFTTTSMFILAYAHLLMVALSMSLVICMFWSLKNELKTTFKSYGLSQFAKQNSKLKKEIITLTSTKNLFYEQVKKDRTFLANKSGMSNYKPKNDIEKREIEKILEIYKIQFDFVTNLETILADSNRSIVNKKENKTAIINY